LAMDPSRKVDRTDYKTILWTRNSNVMSDYEARV